MSSGGKQSESRRSADIPPWNIYIILYLQYCIGYVVWGKKSDPAEHELTNKFDEAFM